MDLLAPFRAKAQAPDEVIVAQSSQITRVMPEWPAANLDNFIREGYEGHELIYACIRKIANSAAHARMIHRNMTEVGGELEEITDGDVAFMLKNPNTDDTQLEFLDFLHTSLQAAGNAYLFKERAGRRVVNLWPLAPQEVSVVPGGRGPNGWVIRRKGVDRQLAAEDVTQMKFTSLTSRWFGLPPMKTAAKIANLDMSATDFSKVFFQNAGVPTGLLKLKRRIGGGQDEGDNVRAKWRAAMAGANRFNIGVLDEDASYEKLGTGLEDLELEDLRDLVESRICATFGVPPILIGANVGLKRGTYANYEEARESFWHETLLPLYKRLASFVQKTMEDDFDVTEIGFDFSEVPALQESETERAESDRTKAQTVALLVTAGFSRPAAVSAAGLPEIVEEEADEVEGTVGVAGEVQQLALNGAQISSLLEVLQQVTLGQIASESGRGLIESAFPFLSAEAVEKMIGNADRFEPEVIALPAPVRSVKQLSASEQEMFLRVQADAFDDVVDDLEAVYEKAFAKQVRNAGSVMGTHIENERANARVKTDIPFNAASLIPVAADEELIAAARPLLLDVAARSWVALDVPELLTQLPFDPEAPPIQQVIRGASQRVTAINETTRKAINEQLRIGSSRGYSIEQIAKGVPKDKFPGVRSTIQETYKNRAKTIARTEVRTSQNLTTSARYQASGITHVEIRDGDVDEPCAAVNGTTQTIEWFAENPTAHPNCTRGAVPIIEVQPVLTGVV